MDRSLLAEIWLYNQKLMLYNSCVDGEGVSIVVSLRVLEVAKDSELIPDQTGNYYEIVHQIVPT